jgi:hypothetical protein
VLLRGPFEISGLICTRFAHLQLNVCSFCSNLAFQF